MTILIRTFVIFCALLATGTGVEGLSGSNIIIGEAAALVGRPLTPGSVAGVARRTTRRTIRRTAVYVSALPRGCSVVVIGGVSLHQCGATYYQPYKGQYVVVKVD